MHRHLRVLLQALRDRCTLEHVLYVKGVILHVVSGACELDTEADLVSDYMTMMTHVFIPRPNSFQTGAWSSAFRKRLCSGSATQHNYWNHCFRTLQGQCLLGPSF